MSGPTIDTPRLSMRQWRDEDLDPLAAILADPDVMAYIGDGSPASPQRARELLARRMDQWASYGFGFWALEEKETGELIGWAGLQRVDWLPQLEGREEVGWLLRRDRWGRGYATEAGGQALDHGFGVVGLERIIGTYQPPNTASGHVMEKLGMEPFGPVLHDERNGRDVAVRAIARERWARIRR